MAAVLALGGCYEPPPPPPTPDIIVYSSTVSGNREIWKASVVGASISNQVKLTTTAASEFSPAISPDGQRVVFHRPGSGLFTVSTDGVGGEVQITTNPNDSDPSWSPDGSKIAFDRTNQDIWIVPVNAAGPTGPAINLTNDAFVDNSPTWSPDGLRLAYDRYIVGGSTDVIVMDADGTDPVNISNDPLSTSEEYSPDWSPDGTRLVMTSNRTPAASSNLYTAAPDGSGFASITVVGGMSNALEPRYSPDGGRLAYYRNSDLEILNLSTGVRTVIVAAAGIDNEPDW